MVTEKMQEKNRNKFIDATKQQVNDEQTTTNRTTRKIIITPNHCYKTTSNGIICSVICIY